MRVHPRHFVNEDNLAANGQPLKKPLQFEERLKPALQAGAGVMPVPPERKSEILQLALHPLAFQSGAVECEFIAEDLVDQKRLANAPPTVNGDKFRVLRFVSRL